MNDEDGVAPRDCRPPGTAVNPAVIVGPGGPAIDAGDNSLFSLTPNGCHLNTSPFRN